MLDVALVGQEPEEQPDDGQVRWGHEAVTKGENAVEAGRSEGRERNSQTHPWSPGVALGAG